MCTLTHDPLKYSHYNWKSIQEFENQICTFVLLLLFFRFYFIYYGSQIAFSAIIDVKSDKEEQRWYSNHYLAYSFLLPFYSSNYFYSSYYWSSWMFFSHVFCSVYLVKSKWKKLLELRSDLWFHAVRVQYVLRIRIRGVYQRYTSSSHFNSWKIFFLHTYIRVSHLNGGDVSSDVCSIFRKLWRFKFWTFILSFTKTRKQKYEVLKISKNAYDFPRKKFMVIFYRF